MGKEVTQKILDRYKNITPATVWTALGKKGYENGLKETIKWFSEEENIKIYKSNIYNY